MRTIHKNKTIPTCTLCEVIFTFDFWFGKKCFPLAIYNGLPILSIISGFVIFSTKDLPIVAYFLASLLFIYSLCVFLMRSFYKFGTT